MNNSTLPENSQKYYEILNSMAKLYSMVYYIDVDQDTFIEIDCKVDDIRDQIGPSGCSSKRLDFFVSTSLYPSIVNICMHFLI